MKTIKNKLNKLAVRAQTKIMEFIQDENGMEIIQVLVLLALALVLIGVFIGFKDEIMKLVNKMMDEFFGKF